MLAFQPPARPAPSRTAPPTHSTSSPQASNHGPEFSTTTRTPFDRLIKEVQELRAADPQERLEEAADVYEVMLAGAALLGVTLADVATMAADKRAERGAFTERICLHCLGS
jgi:predicted house-cleaning noncanonical NTP pyrophosphatase (MazG superfamily)